MSKNPKNWWKLMKIANIDRNSSSSSSYDNYYNIKSHRKPGFPPLFRRYISQKTTGGVKLTNYM